MALLETGSSPANYPAWQRAQKVPAEPMPPSRGSRWVRPKDSSSVRLRAGAPHEPTEAGLSSTK